MTYNVLMGTLNPTRSLTAIQPSFDFHSAAFRSRHYDPSPTCVWADTLRPK